MTVTATATKPSNGTIYRLDKKRHGGGKLGAKLSHIGNRHQQLAVINATGGSMLQAIEPTSKRQRQVNFNPVEAEDYDRFVKIRATVKKTTAPLFKDLIDAYEGKMQPTPLPIVTEAANIVTQVQGKHHLPTQLETVRRMADAMEQVYRNATTITTLERRVDELKTELITARTEASTFRQRYEAKPKPAASTAVQDILIDFIAAFAGTTATADASGELAVDIPQEKQFELFLLWRKAAGELAKKEVA